MKYDVAIIGGGILGASTARLLSQYKLDIAVLEREYDIGEGATKANSGIVAAGFHPRAKSLKGISCARGNAMFPQMCEELGVPFKRVGSLYVAFHQDGVDAMMQKYEKGIQNGVPDMKIINGDEARKREPLLSDKVIKALYAPTTGIVSPFQLVLKTAQNAVKNGVEFLFDTIVEEIEHSGDGYLIHTNGEDIYADFVVNTSGEMAASIEHFVRPADLIIKPRRGQFYILDKGLEKTISGVIYQAQETDEGGVVIAPTVEGNIIIGPTSENVREYKCTETTRESLDKLERVLKKVLPGMDVQSAITNFAGVRANIKNVVKEEKDFVIRVSAPGFVSALGIKNPGMTSSPYLCQRIVDLLIEEGMPHEKNADFDPYMKPYVKMVDRNVEEKAALYECDPRYGNIICRCEQVTEGDILAILSEPLPPRTINGLKKRLRTGMGRCQGGFCTPRIVEILSRELSLPPEKIEKGLSGSNLVLGRLK